ncbi:MAG: DNA recombination protein RmuC [Clostridia bacterium]|nr:DNA recombination protein RmuC [Clostridia bacterium]
MSPDSITLYLLIAVIALLVIAVAALFMLIKKSNGKTEHEDSEKLQRLLADEFERSRREMALGQNDMRSQTSQSIGEMAKKLDEMTKANFESQQRMTQTLSDSLGTIRQNNAEQNDRLSRNVSEAIGRMQESNEKKLDQMRATVDEKLSATLNERLNSSFKTVSDQLENVNKSLGEMKELSNGVTANVSTLNKVLTNVKARGTWAEVYLENILDQTIPGMYVKNYAPIEGSQAKVEFAVKIPAGDGSGNITYLPIDSKFPMEDYVRLCTAAENADPVALAAARKALESRVKDEAKLITKYIVVPQTTPYAIMYLATEGLYAEIAASPDGLPEKLRSEYNIMIAGPTTITALLSSLSMGFKAVAINEKANEVRQMLAVAKTQYDKFGDLLEKARRRIDDAGKALGEAQNRNRIIQKKLKGVEAVESAEEAAILEEKFFEGE